MHSADDMLAKAKERGYDLWMHSSDKTWYSLINERNHINLELYVKTGDFVLNHLKGIIKITTGKCGSFMDDEHFKRIEKDMRKVLMDLM
jgi:hypothetical protein